MKHKKSCADQRGFTIIETTLFLALSAALVLVAILGTGTLIRSVRFSDSVRSTHSFIQSQYDEILNGVNPRNTAEVCGSSSPKEPGKGNCLLLGKLLHFDLDTSSIKSYYVVSSGVPDPADPDLVDASDADLIEAAEPEVVKGIGVAEFTVPWGATVFDAKRIGGDGDQVNTYALLRSPRSSRLVAYTFSINGSQLSSSGVTSLLSYVEEPGNIQQATNFCIDSVDAPDPPAAITVAQGQGQDAIAVNFNLGSPAQIDAACGSTP